MGPPCGGENPCASRPDVSKGKTFGSTGVDYSSTSKSQAKLLSRLAHSFQCCIVRVKPTFCPRLHFKLHTNVELFEIHADSGTDETPEQFRIVFYGHCATDDETPHPGLRGRNSGRPPWFGYSCRWRARRTRS